MRRHLATLLSLTVLGLTVAPASAAPDDRSTRTAQRPAARASAAEQRTYAPPVDRRAEAAPVERRAAAPVERHTYAAPVERRASAAPVERRAYAAPVERHAYAAPVQRRAYAPATAPRSEVWRPSVTRASHSAPRAGFVPPGHTFVAPGHTFVAPGHTFAAPRAAIAPRNTVVVRRHASIAPARTIVAPGRIVRITRGVTVVRSSAPQRVVVVRGAHRTVVYRYRTVTRVVRPRTVAYVAGRVVRVTRNVVIVQPPTGRAIPVNVAYVPAYRTIAVGVPVAVPVLANGSTYYAYQPQNVIPYTVSTLLPLGAQTYPAYFQGPIAGSLLNAYELAQYFGYGGSNWNGCNQYSNGDEDAQDDAGACYGQTAAYGYPQYGSPQYGYSPYNNGYGQYASYPQYDYPQYPQYGYPQYPGQQYGYPPYGDQQYGYPQYGSPQYGNAPYGNFGMTGIGPENAYSPYYVSQHLGSVMGLVVGRSGNDVIVLTQNLQPVIVNASAIGSANLAVGRPVVAYGFYDPSNTLIAMSVM